MNQIAIDFAAHQRHDHAAERDIILEVVACKAEMFRAEFYLWLQENWHIWKAFEAEAARTWDRGRRHYSARTICEYLRHETALSEHEGEWKINGNAVPDLARLYGLRNPDKEGMFETRVQKRSWRTT